MVVVVVGVGEREEGGFGGIDGFAPELDVEVCEVARVLVDGCVAEDEFPGADAGFAPGVCVLVVVGLGIGIGGTYQCTTLMKVQSA